MAVNRIDVVPGDVNQPMSKGRSILSKAQEELSQQVLKGGVDMFKSSIDDMFAEMMGDPNALGLAGLNALWEATGSSNDTKTSDELIREVLGEIRHAMLENVNITHAINAFDRYVTDHAFSETRCEMIMNYILKETLELEHEDGTKYYLKDLNEEEAAEIIKSIPHNDKKKFASAYLYTHPEVWENTSLYT